MKVTSRGGFLGWVFNGKLGKIHPPRNSAMWFWCRVTACIVLLAGWVVYLTGHERAAGWTIIAGAVIAVAGDQVDRVEKLARLVTYRRTQERVKDENR